jgi:prepilin-type N-terminal cleavage/methylation domain-containing protein
MNVHRKRAFTLIELLVALTLGLAVVAAAWSALSSSIDASRRLDSIVEESATLSNLSRTISTQLANAHYSRTSALAPVFTITPSTASAQGTQAPKDSITFSFAYRSTCPAADPQYPFYTVTYFIAEASEVSPGGLSRRMTPLWPSDVAQAPRDELIAPEVRGLGLSCFDGVLWTGQWDAAASGLPRALRLDLYVDSARFGRDTWRTDIGEKPASALAIHRVAAFVSWPSPSSLSGSAGTIAAAGGNYAPAS